MAIYKNITDTIGNTPLVRINRLAEKSQAQILAKLEFFNPASCVKERIALSMIDDAEKSGLLKPGGLIIEPTSGNTGIGLAIVAAARGYQLIITMPESMSIERRKVLAHLGAKIVLTPAAEGMRGAINKAEDIANETPGSFVPQQFSNPANPAAHFDHTGPEIWEDTDGKVDFFVSGVGTGGTLTGVGEYLLSKNPEVQIIAVEPTKSPVIEGGQPGAHSIQGIGAGFIPDNLDLSVISETISVSDEDSIKEAKRLAKYEGIFCGISSGAVMVAALELANRPENAGKNIVVLLPDTGERYISTALFEND